jgi:ribonuclease T2
VPAFSETNQQENCMFKKLCLMTATPLASLLLAGFASVATAQEAPINPSSAQQLISAEMFDDELDEDEIFFDEQLGRFAKKAAARSFDYYLLAMSWSPDYCLTHASDTQQCGKGFAFVIHGLWPQNLSGANPSNCSTSFKLTQGAVDVALPYMPSNSLISHEWSKHGVCAGVSSLAYFTNAVNAFKSINVPSYLTSSNGNKTVSLTALRRDFSQSSGLAGNQFSVQCDGNKLQEIRVCLTKQLGAATCGAGIADSCPATLTVVAQQ